MASFPVHDAFMDELSCPVCFEDFVEPKCLPGCAHNVCKICLEDTVKAQPKTKRGYFECPICREKAMIPNGGISKSPTNTLIVRMLERSLVPRAQQEIARALERSKEKIAALKMAQDSNHSGAVVDVKKKGEELKRRIEERGDALRKLIKSQEEMMIAKVNDYVKKFAHKNHVSEVNSLLKRLEISVKQAEDFLKEPSHPKMLESKVAIVKKLETSCHFEMNSSKATRNFDFDFFPNENLEECLKKECYGKLAKGSGETDSATRHQGKAQVLKTITVDDIGETSFNPYTVAVSAEKGEMAVLDDESNRVYLLTQSGNYLRSFGVKFGDLYDIAFVSDKCLDGILVVNRSHNRLLAYHRLNGRFYPMFYATYQSLIHSQCSKVNFSSVTPTSDGRLIVTSEGLDESCVMVIDMKVGRQSKDLIFGKGHLACPRKALFYNGEFFVCDRDDGTVKVFDARGAFRREIGEDLECPRGITIDKSTGNILIADPGTDSIYAHQTWDGSLVGKLSLDKPPISIGLNGQGSAVVCYHDNQSPCLQIMSFQF